MKRNEQVTDYVDRICHEVYTMNPIDHREVIRVLAEECYKKGVNETDAEWKHVVETEYR